MRDEERRHPTPDIRHPARHGWCCTPNACACCLFVWLVFVGVMLYPVFVRVRGGSQRSCLAAIRPAGQALRMYAEDFDDRLPPARDWMDASLPYARSRTAFACPTIQWTVPGAFGYALNSAEAGALIPMSAARADTALLFDSARLDRNATAPYPTGLCRPGRHNGADYVAFLDGHAKRLLTPR